MSYIKSSDRINSIPVYAFAEINQKVANLKKLAAEGKAKSPIDFGVGDPSEPTPDFVIDKLVEIGRKHATTGYPDYVGSGDLRGAAARYMKRNFGVELDPETEICSSVGSKEAVFNFANAFVNDGDVVICPSPCYPPMKTGAIFAGAETYFSPLLRENDWLLDYESIPLEVCERAKIIWINYPNSPTGATASTEYYQGLIAWARKNEIIIAADEGCYIDIYYDQKPLSILQVASDMGSSAEDCKSGIVTFYSLSKRNNMTGYRVGFVAGDAEIINTYKKFKTHVDSGTANIMQEAGILALEDDEHVAYMRELYEKKLEILMKALDDLRIRLAEEGWEIQDSEDSSKSKILKNPEEVFEIKKSDATFFYWQQVPAGMSDIEFAKKLLDPEVGLVVTPGSAIADPADLPVGIEVPEGSLLPEINKFNPGFGYVRFALMPTMEQMDEAAERIRNLKI